MAAYWEIATHSDHDMFSQYKYLIVNLFVFSPRVLECKFFLIAHCPDQCLLISISYKTWLKFAKWFQRRRSMKLWTDDGRTQKHGYTISSTCEPYGELRTAILQ